MSSVEQQYISEMMYKFGGYYATWNPGVNLMLGDIGVLSDDVFTRISNIANLGIKFNVRQDETKLPLEHQSQGAVKVTAKVAGTVAPARSVLGSADAGVIVEFNKANATLFKALGTTSPSIEDTIALEEAILDLYGQGKWKSNWVVITELVKAESATIIISNSASGKIEIKATANLDTPKIDVADLSLGLTTEYSKGLETSIVATENLTPLFKVMHLETSFWGEGIGLETNRLSALDFITPFSSKNEHLGKLHLRLAVPKSRD